MRRDRLEVDNSVFRAPRPLLFEATEHFVLGKRQEAEFIELKFRHGEALATDYFSLGEPFTPEQESYLVNCYQGNRGDTAQSGTTPAACTRTRNGARP